jgi:GNAT superfamily N-acetyltransferase
VAPDRSGLRLITGGQDPALVAVLDAGPDEFNFAATGTSKADQGSFSVKVVDENGEIAGGLTAWYWAGLCGISMMRLREDSREGGWGSKILLAAEEEASRRGCDRVCVSSFTFQAPGFYQRHGYVETGRALGIPGGAEDVHMFKQLSRPKAPDTLWLRRQVSSEQVANPAAREYLRSAHPSVDRAGDLLHSWGAAGASLTG